MIKLCQNRGVLFDNMTSNIERREMQRRKLLDAVDFVISSNGGTSFSYKMLPHIQVIDSAFSSITSGYMHLSLFSHLCFCSLVAGSK